MRKKESLVLLLFIALLFCLGGKAQAQVCGTVTSVGGDKLMFATVYIDGTTNGVYTNENGEFCLKEVEQGTHTLVIQYLGYQSQRMEINYQDQALFHVIEMIEESQLTDSIIVRANAENPALAIIRKVQAKRKNVLDAAKNFSAKAYMKNTFKHQGIPDNMIGRMIKKEMKNIVGSDSSNIIYLSESLSNIYKLDSKEKEVVRFYNKSGFKLPFTLNSAINVMQDVYQNQIDLMGSYYYSPISDQALSHYDYLLEQATLNDRGKYEYKISFKPKNKMQRVFDGVIYINEEFWEVRAVQLHIDKERSASEVLQDVNIDLFYLRDQQGVLYPVQQKWEALISVFGISFDMLSIANYQNIQGNVNPSIFDSYVHSVDDQVHAYSNEIWDSLRPAPLTTTEINSYQYSETEDKKSALRRDSMLNAKNPFKILDLLKGYSDISRSGYTRFNYDLLKDEFFDPIRGFNLGIKLRVARNEDSTDYNYHVLSGELGYGFSDKKVRGALRYYLRTKNAEHPTYFQLDWSNKLRSFAGREYPFSHLFMELYALFTKNNYLQSYTSNKIDFRLKKELLLGWDVQFFGGYEQRKEERNHSNFSFSKREEKYATNIPDNPFVNTYKASVSSSNIIVAGTSFRLDFGRKKIKMVKQVFNVKSQWPKLFGRINYKYNLTDKSNLVELAAKVTDGYNLKKWGRGDYRITYRAFVGDRPAFFQDYHQYDGNETAIFSTFSSANYMALSYFSFASPNDDWQLGIKHRFEGNLLHLIPLIRKLKWETTLGANVIFLQGLDDYQEYYLGIENIGIKLIRPFKVALVYSKWGTQKFEPKFMFGVTDVLSQNSSSVRIKPYFP